MSRQVVLDRMVDRIYDAALDPVLWPAVWQGMVDAFGAATGCLINIGGAASPPLRLAMPGWGDQALARYERHFHTADIWAIRSLARPTLRAELGQELVADDEWERSEIWNDFSRSDLGAYHLLGAVVPFGKDGVWLAGIHRPRDASAFDAADRADLTRVLGHMRRGLAIRQRLADSELRAALGFGALDALDIGALVVTGAGRVVFSNRAADAIARDGDALHYGRKGFPIAAGATGLTPLLRCMIADAAAGGAGGEILLPRASGGRGVAAMVSRLPRSAGPGSDVSACVLILLHDLTARHVAVGALLRGLFGATVAEADLAERLFDGQHLRDIAEARGVRISTVRTQLSALLARTDTSGQAELLKLLASLRLLGSATEPAS